jgi:hypothetical protein
MQIPKAQAIDPRFPYEYETPPPSYETATTHRATGSHRDSPMLSYASAIESDISEQHGDVDSVPGGSTPIPLFHAERMIQTRDSPMSVRYGKHEI